MVDFLQIYENLWFSDWWMWKCG